MGLKLGLTCGFVEVPGDAAALFRLVEEPRFMGVLSLMLSQAASAIFLPLWRITARDIETGWTARSRGHLSASSH